MVADEVLDDDGAIACKWRVWAAPVIADTDLDLACVPEDSLATLDHSGRSARWPKDLEGAAICSFGTTRHDTLPAMRKSAMLRPEQQMNSKNTFLKGGRGVCLSSRSLFSNSEVAKVGLRHWAPSAQQRQSSPCVASPALRNLLGITSRLVLLLHPFSTMAESEAAATAAAPATATIAVKFTSSDRAAGQVSIPLESTVGTLKDAIR